MSKNSYFPDPNVLSKVGLEFFETRPQIRILILCVNFFTLLMASLIILILQVNHEIASSSIIFLIATYVWLTHRRTIQRLLMKYRFKKSINKHNKEWFFDFNKFKIKAVINNLKLDITWKSLRSVFYIKSLSGYMIPLTGMKNAGRFVWLPESGFEDETALQNFIKFLSDNKIKVKERK